MPGSGEGDQAAAGSSNGQGAPLRSLDYPCTARLRLRRLLAYHRRHNYEEIYEVARDKMRVIFDVRNLVKNVKFGQWRKASIYVFSFVPPGSMSYECGLLLRFLHELMVFDDFADGFTNVSQALYKWFASIYRDPALDAYPCFPALVADVLFLRSDHARAFLKWQLVRNKAAEMAEEMAYNTPELKDKLHFPRGPNNLYHVVAIGSSFHRRRRVKNLGRQQSIDLAQFYLLLKKRLPSSSQGESNVFSAGPAKIQEEPLIALLEKALQVGRRSLLVLPKEGFPLMQMLTESPLLAKPLRVQVRGPEHSSKQDTPQSSAVVAFSPPEFPSKEAMKRMSFRESDRHAAHPGNDSKKPRTNGNFGEFWSAGKATNPAAVTSKSWLWRCSPQLEYVEEMVAKKRVKKPFLFLDEGT